jgi:DNA recombination protein RmuC
MVLERILESSGLIDGTHYQKQPTIETNDGSRQRPDIVITLPQGKEIVIDSKAVMSSYLDAIVENQDKDSENGFRQHSEHLKVQIDELSKKEYYNQFTSPEFVILFLPSESLFSVAIQNDTNLIEYGLSKE